MRVVKPGRGNSHVRIRHCNNSSSSRAGSPARPGKPFRHRGWGQPRKGYFSATRARPNPSTGLPVGSSRVRRPSVHTLLNRAVSPVRITALLLSLAQRSCVRFARGLPSRLSQTPLTRQDRRRRFAGKSADSPHRSVCTRPVAGSVNDLQS